MVNGNDAQLRAIKLALGKGGRVLERGVSRVNADGVVLAVGVAGDIGDDAEASVGARERLEGDERRGGVSAQVDGVDKDVRVGNLLKGSAAAGLGHIPLGNEVLGDAHSVDAIKGASAAAAKGTDNDDLGVLAVVGGHGLLDLLLDQINELLCRVDNGGRAEGHAGTQDLLGPREQGEGSTSKAGRLAKGGDTAAALFEEFEIVEQAAGVGEARELGSPAGLLLEDVCEVDVGVGQGS